MLPVLTLGLEFLHVMASQDCSREDGSVTNELSHKSLQINELILKEASRACTCLAISINNGHYEIITYSVVAATNEGEPKTLYCMYIHNTCFHKR